MTFLLGIVAALAPNAAASEEICVGGYNPDPDSLANVCYFSASCGPYVVGYICVPEGDLGFKVNVKPLGYPSAIQVDSGYAGTGCITLNSLYTGSPFHFCVIP